METILLSNYANLHKQILGGGMHFVSDDKGLLTSSLVCPNCKNTIPVPNGIYYLGFILECSNQSCKHVFAIIKA